MAEMGLNSTLSPHPKSENKIIEEIIYDFMVQVGPSFIAEFLLPGPVPVYRQVCRR